MTQAEENFQPQVRDTTNGPNIHTYIPRADGSVLIEGIIYVPQCAATSTCPAAPVGTQSYIIPPGGPAVPAFNVPQPQMVYPQHPVYPQPAVQYPYQPYQPYPQYIIQPHPSATGLPTVHMTQPAQHTIGLTSNEIFNQQLATAQSLEMNKKQEMKPADDDPLRMYWVRECDGTYTQRNRLTIDSGDIGECRWYAQDGVFYAVRLPS